MSRLPHRWSVLCVCALAVPSASVSYGQYSVYGSGQRLSPSMPTYQTSPYQTLPYQTSPRQPSSYSTSQPVYRSSPYVSNAGYSQRSYSTGYHRMSSGYAQRPRGPQGEFRDLKTASPGHYTSWRTAPGTSRTGYLAADGSRWKLMQSTGSVQIDSYGRRYRVSDAQGTDLAWKIDRQGAPSKSAWIARDEKTGNISVLYRRPEIVSDTKFYPASVRLDGGRITAISWRIKPSWADSAAIVKGYATPRLPAASYRSTSQPYMRASQSDLVAAQNAMRVPAVARTRRVYDEMPVSNAVPVRQTQAR